LTEPLRHLHNDLRFCSSIRRIVPQMKLLEPTSNAEAEIPGPITYRRTLSRLRDLGNNLEGIIAPLFTDPLQPAIQPATNQRELTQPEFQFEPPSHLGS
jgi:hypothetical protein